MEDEIEINIALTSQQVTQADVVVFTQQFCVRIERATPLPGGVRESIAGSSRHADGVGEVDLLIQ